MDILTPAEKMSAALTKANARIAALEAEVAPLRELLNDRETDLLYEATGRHTAEDALDEVRQTLGVPAPISVVDAAARIVLENDEAHAEVARLRAALKLAHEYVVKGNEQGAYTGCVLSGETVLARIDLALNTGQDAQGG